MSANKKTVRISRLPQGHNNPDSLKPDTLRSLLPNRLQQMSLLHRRAG